MSEYRQALPEPDLPDPPTWRTIFVAFCVGIAVAYAVERCSAPEPLIVPDPQQGIRNQENPS